MEDSLESGQPGVAVELASNWPRVTGDESSFNREMPVFFPPGVGKGDSVAARVRQIPEAFGQDRIAKAHKDSVRRLSRPGQISGQGCGATSPTLEMMTHWKTSNGFLNNSRPPRPNRNKPNRTIIRLRRCLPAGGLNGGVSQGPQGLAYGWAWPICHPSQMRIHIALLASRRSPKQKTLSGHPVDISACRPGQNTILRARSRALPLCRPDTRRRCWIPYGRYVVSMARPSVAALTMDNVLSAGHAVAALSSLCHFHWSGALHPIHLASSWPWPIGQLPNL